MKRKLTFLAAALVMVSALAFETSHARLQNSCQGRCNRAYQACINKAATTSDAAQCNKSYQGCISSCHL